MPLWLCRTSVPCEAIARRIRRTARRSAPSRLLQVMTGKPAAASSVTIAPASNRQTTWQSWPGADGAMGGGGPARPQDGAGVGAVAHVAGDDRDAGRGARRDHRAGLEQSDHLAVVARRRLCHGEVDDDALQPAAVQVLDDVADPHGSLDTVTRNLPLAVNGMSSTRCRSRLASLPSTLVISRRT